MQHLAFIIQHCNAPAKFSATRLLPAEAGVIFAELLETYPVDARYRLELINTDT